MLEPTKVQINLYSPAAAKFDCRTSPALTGPLESYLNEMLGGLHVNRTCSVEVAATPDRYDSLVPVRVLIDGIRCVQPVAPDTQYRGRNLKSLRAQIEQCVYINRALFVSERLARDYRRAWALEGKHDAFLIVLLRRLVSQGYSLDRAKVWLESGGDPEVDVDAAFEEALGAESVLVHLYLPQDQRNFDNAPLISDLSRCCVELGLGLLQITLAFRDMPSDCICQLRINNLLLPPVRRDAPSDGRNPQSWVAPVKEIISSSLPRLIAPATVASLLGSARERYPVLERELRRRFAGHRLTSIFRDLAEDAIPIYDVKTIAEALLMANGRTVAGAKTRRLVFTPETALFSAVQDPRKGGLSISEQLQVVRKQMRRGLGERFAPSKRLFALLLSVDLEEKFDADDYRRIDHRQLRRLVKEIKSARSSLGQSGQPVPIVLLTGEEARAEIRRTLKDYFPELPVLAWSELSEDVSVDDKRRIDLGVESQSHSQALEALGAQDEDIDQATEKHGPVEDDSNKPQLGTLLEGMEALGAVFKKLQVRLEGLGSAADDDMREFWTQEVEIVEAEMEARKFVPSLSADFDDAVDDLMSSLVRTAKGRDKPTR